MRVRELTPGDRWRSGDTEAIFITQAPHPVYRRLRLVVWWIVRDDHGPRYSFDALRADQELVGELVRHPLGVDDEVRQANIREALGLK